MKDNKSFLNDLKVSQSNVNKFASLLRNKGVQTFLIPSEVRPESSQRREYADDGDGVIQLRFEYKKRRNMYFTSIDDYKFDTVIVDEVYNFNQKTSRWLFYAIENAQGSHVAIVWYFTKKYWTVQSNYDKYQNRKSDYYVCPVEKVQFLTLEDLFNYDY